MAVNWWVLDILNGPGPATLVAWVFWVVFSICLHELSHGWAAISRGDRTPIEMGHMTWNPLKHMGKTSLILFAVAGIAFGAMPVNPRRMHGKYADAFVSVAGPTMNVLLAVLACVCAAVAILLGHGQLHHSSGTQTLVHVFDFFFLGAELNLALAVFNLLPVPPLDGSRILADFVPAYRRLLHTEVGQGLSFVVFLLAFFFAGDLVFKFGAEGSAAMVHAIVFGLKAVGL